MWTEQQIADLLAYSYTVMYTVRVLAWCAFFWIGWSLWQEFHLGGRFDLGEKQKWGKE